MPNVDARVMLGFTVLTPTYGSYLSHEKDARL